MKNKKEKPIRRTFSQDLKQKIVKDLLDGKASVSAVCREYSVSTTSVYRWLGKYSTYGQKGVKVVLELDSEGYRTKELEQRLKDAEAALGRKQMEVDFLEKMIEIAGKEYGIDIKKKSDIRRSTGSGPSKEKEGTK
jgi:transposase-like protein